MESYKNDTYEANCTVPSIWQFPGILTADHPPRYGYVAIAGVFSMYSFLAMVVVSHEYFVPSVERLCYKLHMTYDMAGATFMAGATSLPEFSVHVIATFVAKGDIGIGTILGSAVVNLFAITALGCVVAGNVFSLDWWPLTRDSIWNTIAVGVLAWELKSGIIKWQGSLLLVVLYVLYLVNLYWDRPMQEHCRTGEGPCLPCFEITGDIPDLVGYMETDPNLDSEKNVYNFTTYPKEDNCISKFYWITSWPLQLLLYITIPDCRRKALREWYVASLFMCTLWMSIFSYMASWMITIIGYNFAIPDSIMGITVIAAGTSIPEAISSIIVTRKGYGSMSFCSCIGSNTFNILVCLGVPWFIKAAFFLDEGQTGIVINSSGLLYVTLLLLGTNFVLYFGLMLTHFTSGPGVGKICFAAYVFYLIFECMLEMNVFGVMNLPQC